ncbi:A/G-specific adenine glycosylase [Sphingomonas sp. URHD0057]|uniref:A/G-specific adenine glycosylase n=1 Tax=Sphingomonas sp. URHD0057 TaxID=1380389 RepID=UPI00048D4484|nr:A/G-specific adenine glycosylase [Sphingomonas sp. URHD0057]
MVTANAATRLIQHYVDNFRRLPWRSPPAAPQPDPYRVWLSEIMLQQTTVAAVMPRFERFVARWPTVEALAAARDEDVLQEWAGLGYYARARNLIACAREIAARGAFPATAAELRALPGIGDYTAGAIAAIAFGERSPAIDTNVRRVIARLDGHESPSSRQVAERVAGLMSQVSPGDLTQAMMDLAAAICSPKTPRCGVCPLNADCAANASGEPERFPMRKARKPRPLPYGVAWWTERDGCVWLVRRPSKGMLGGMAALPGSDWVEAALKPPEAIGTVRHVFTHFALDLCVARRSAPVGEGWWQPIETLDRAGLPTLYRRAAELAASASETRRAAA